MFKKIIIAGWIFSALLLFLYSFTQIDLGLTLTRVSFWQTIQKSFQQIGYFNRPFSTGIHLSIVLTLFLLYGFTLHLIKNNRINRRDLWLIIVSVSTILLFSYNAFSYDLFNYIFDAKIVTYYHQNPYEHKALDYPGDPMLSFMHWTHRTYPYGPFWLVLTVPLSFIGFGFFLPTLYLFKALPVLSFLFSAYFIEKIAEKTKIVNPLFAVTFFALNPLVLIESLVSAHNDIVMVSFAIGSFYLLLKNKIVRSLFLLLLSIGIKFATIFLIPAYILYIIFRKKAKEAVFIALIFMIIPIFIATARTNFQPWYLLYVLPFASFLSNRYFVLIPTIIVSLFSLLRYLPFLYLGNWNPPVTQINVGLNIASIVLSLIGVFIYRLFFTYQTQGKA